MLFRSGTGGIVIAMGAHLMGYLRMMDGYTESSLLARAIPGNFIDGTPGYWLSVLLFLVLIGGIMLLSAVFVKRVEFHWGT